jgi:hypothetical protein
LGDELPTEYVDLFLCRDVYHCLPSQLQAEDAVEIQKHLAMLAAEAQVRGMKW